MSIVRKEYIVHFDDANQLPHPLPTWFTESKYNKIIKVSGATVAYKLGPTVDEQNVPVGVRIVSNLSKNTFLEGFIMMANNYNSIKEFDVTYQNLTQLTWTLLASDGKLLKDTLEPTVEIDMVVELEYILKDDS